MEQTNSVDIKGTYLHKYSIYCAFTDNLGINNI